MTAARRRSLRPAIEPLELVQFTRFVADEVRRGAYPFVEHAGGERWHRRLYRDRRMDIWLISWLPAHGTSLHDHGGSCGAFTVVDGVLSEAVYAGGRAGLRDREHPAGRSVGFGVQHVHDVRNLVGEPALSVHAYSPPLTSMTYYEVGNGGLTPLSRETTDVTVE